MENYKPYYEYWKENKTKCKYDIVVESCRRCLFETICRLNSQKQWEEL
jgi:hypothetical protein